MPICELEIGVACRLLLADGPVGPRPVHDRTRAPVAEARSRTSGIGAMYRGCSKFLEGAARGSAAGQISDRPMRSLDAHVMKKGGPVVPPSLRVIRMDQKSIATPKEKASWLSLLPHASMAAMVTLLPEANGLQLVLW